MRDYRLYLMDILDAIEKIKRYTGKVRGKIKNDFRHSQS